MFCESRKLAAGGQIDSESLMLVLVRTYRSWSPLSISTRISYISVRMTSHKFIYIKTVKNQKMAKFENLFK